MSKGLFAACVAALLALTAFADTAAARSSLWGRDFVAASVRGAHGKPTPITDPGDVHVSFSRGHHAQWINWEANCNGFGAKVRIAGGRLRLTEIISTAKACVGGGRSREDAWLARFFEANPHWRLRGGHLRLSSHGRAMRLRAEND